MVDVSPAEAKRIIGQLASDSGRIFVVQHASEKMHERDVDFLDIQRCLMHGVVTEGPYVHDISSGMWRVRMEARVAGENVRVVAEITGSDDDMVVVVTVF